MLCKALEVREMTFLFVLGIILSIAVIIVALNFILVKKQYAIGICIALVGIIILLGSFVIKENDDKKKKEEINSTQSPSATQAVNPTETNAPGTAVPTEASTSVPTSEPTVNPTETVSPKFTPEQSGDYYEVHYDSATIVKPDNWNGKTIYLTFDDGPSSTTKYVLDNLARYNVKCTFFVIGNQVGDYLQYEKRALEEGHTIGVHAYIHEYDQIYTSVDAYLTDFNKCVDLLRNKLSYNPLIFRFPGGTSNTTSKQYCKGIMTELSKIMPEKGYSYCDWNVSPEDAMSVMTVDEIFEATKKEILSTSGNNKYVLMHDYGGMKNSADAALRIIEWGLENGYAFDRLTPETTMYRHGVNN